MTIVGVGDVVIRNLSTLTCFDRDFRKLDPQLQKTVKEKLEDLLRDPRPSGLKFEKEKGYSNPDIYTIHVTGNYKISMEIVGDKATLRRVGNHDEIDRAP